MKLVRGIRKKKKDQWTQQKSIISTYSGEILP